MDENWYKVIEASKDDEILEYLKSELDKKNIKYKIDLEERWEGSIKTPKYVGKFVLYVQNEFYNQIEEILNKYYENNAVSVENIEDFGKNEDNIEKESKKIFNRQKIILGVYIGIVMLMVISVIIATIIF